MVARWRRAVVVTALPLALLACSSPSGSSPGSTPTATPTPTAPTASSLATSGGVSPSAPSLPGGSGATTTRGVPGTSGVTISRTGGIAGVQQTIVIAADGSWTYTDGRDGSTQQGKLTTAQREDIDRLAGDPAIVAESRAKASTARCSDGFIYTIGLGEISTRYEQCGATKRPATDQLLAAVLQATPL
jgi:hypothetical protein